jgi:MGT family glycosyltransferase
MTKYIFLNIPAHGHVNSTLAVVHELVARGEEVIYYLTEDFRASVEATGATFQVYDSLLSHIQLPTNFSAATNNSNVQNMLPVRMVDESFHVLPQVYESISSEKPDFIVYDVMCLWAKVLVRSLHIPAILYRPSYFSNPHIQRRYFRGGPASTGPGPGPESFTQINGKLADLCRQYHIEPFGMQEMFMGSEPLNISFMPREFQPLAETFDERFVFVGLSAMPRPNTTGFPLEKLVGQKVLFISLGTVFNDQAAFFNTCFEAFKEKSWLVVLAYGKNVNLADLDAVPENFLIAPYVPQLEVLMQTNAFITHGGMNSTMESVYYGVPMIVVPQMVEQNVTARRVDELGLGIALYKENITVEGLREAVEQVMDNPAYREHVLEMQKHVIDAGGYKRAADAIMGHAYAVKSATNV